MTNFYRFKFIDLFAGIGGFHQALSELGGECVFASEIDEACKRTYENQFKTKIFGDINNCINKIPEFDVLCAGFPCQTFSKAGNQEGFKDEVKGKLFFRIVEILKKHKECKFIILENVRNLADNTEFWNIIQKELESLNFYVTKEPIILSPDNFGIPQNRERVYILGIRKSISKRTIKKKKQIQKDDLQLENHYRECADNEALSVLENRLDNKEYVISKTEKELIRCWEDFKKTISPRTQIGAPIWLDYFGMDVEPGNEKLFKIKHNYYKQRNKNGKCEKTPDWKRKFILRNREFYINNKSKIDEWYQKYKEVLTNKTYRKFEWNCGEEYTSFKNCIIQIRQSGLRVKRLDKFPSLVAIVNTPIIWDDVIKEYRKISIREAANLQCFVRDFAFLGDKSTIYKQLGNSVNVQIIRYISEGLFNLSNEGENNG